MANIVFFTLVALYILLVLAISYRSVQLMEELLLGNLWKSNNQSVSASNIQTGGAL